MWDCHYGSMGPSEVLGYFRKHIVNVEAATVPDVDVPPELEREVTALRSLARKVKAVTEAFDDGRSLKPRRY